MATTANLFLPYDVNVDADDNIYIADSNNYRVRKVLKNGFIMAVAGTGTTGFSGDGGPATSAQISSPEGIAVSPAGDVYFSHSHRISVVFTNGTITTFSGTGTSGFNDNTRADLAILWNPAYMNFGRNNSDLYFSERGTNRVRKISNGFVTTVAGMGSSSYCGENIDSSLCELSKPKAAAMDALGNVYVAGMFK